MSESDSFVDEVSEEVRRDRLFATFRKYAWIPILLVVGIVGGTVANEYLKNQKRAAAQAAGDALYAALETEDAAARADALGAVVLETPGQQVLAQMTQAAVLVSDDQTDAAFDVLRAASELEGAEPAYTGLAALKAAMIRPEDPWSAEALERLSQPGQPYRLLALEQVGLAKVAAGDTEGGLADLGAVLEDAGVTASMAQRVAQVITALGGELPSFENLVSGNG